MRPRYSTSSCSNRHFSAFLKRVLHNTLARRISRTRRTIPRSSSSNSVKMRMLSMNTTTTPSSMRLLKMSFIIVWKVAGLFVSPKNMTRGSYRPLFVRKAAFHSSPSFMRTLLYPQ
ncbi:hypothetical protein JB92DRAFT_2858824 [Gautieria morchelliformis]|nr:hypothetical protein JB92DRAFT_2858824 [Gautieria morchelliformis]